MATPATVFASVTAVPSLVTTPKTKPWRPLGIVTSLFASIGANTVVSPEKIAKKRAPEPESVYVSLTFLPGAAVPLTASAGKAVKGRAWLDAGHEVMKDAASVKTWFWSKGVWKEPENGAPFCGTELIQAAWRASVARMLPAAVSTPGSVRNFAPPRYAVVPTFSRMLESAMKDSGSV